MRWLGVTGGAPRLSLYSCARRPWPPTAQRSRHRVERWPSTIAAVDVAVDFTQQRYHHTPAVTRLTSWQRCICGSCGCEYRAHQRLPPRLCSGRRRRRCSRQRSRGGLSGCGPCAAVTRDRSVTLRGRQLQAGLGGGETNPTEPGPVERRGDSLRLCHRSRRRPPSPPPCLGSAVSSPAVSPADAVIPSHRSSGTSRWSRRRVPIIIPPAVSLSCRGLARPTAHQQSTSSHLVSAALSR